MPSASLRNDQFDARCEELDLLTEVAKAAFVGVNVATLYRYRRRQLVPQLDQAFWFIRRLGFDHLEDLWEEAS